MATGVPSKKSLRARRLESLAGGIRLEYPGKRSTSDILASPSAEIAFRWEGRPNATNRLYFGDNLPVLATLLANSHIAGKVQLIYIDPPYSTETVFHSRNLTRAYEDVLSGPAYIESLRSRLVMLRELLAEDGSLYLHLDGKMLCNRSPV